MMLAVLSAIAVVSPVALLVLMAHVLLWRQPHRITNHIFAIGFAIVLGILIQIARGAF